MRSDDVGEVEWKIWMENACLDTGKAVLIRIKNPLSEFICIEWERYAHKKFSKWIPIVLVCLFREKESERGIRMENGLFSSNTINVFTVQSILFDCSK